jgi:hypothetical protein
MASRTYQVRCAPRWETLLTATGRPHTSYVVPACDWIGTRRRQIRHGQPTITTDPLAKPCPKCGNPVQHDRRSAAEGRAS